MNFAEAFPTYLEMRNPLPRWVWQAASGVAVLAAVGLIALCFIDPRMGLIVWWLWVLPVLPLSWMLAPGIWRNVCPMAMLNQVPRLFGFTRGLTAPKWLREHAFVVQAAMYFALISTRAPVFDHYGRALGVLMASALILPLAGGVLFKGKSGWCGTLCPLMPIQRLYGQSPAVAVPNAHCATCVGCTKNCYDLNPRAAMLRDMEDEDPGFTGSRKIFAGTFPGFVVAFFTLPKAAVADPVNVGMPIWRYYALVGAAMLLSLGIFALVDWLNVVSPTMLTAVFGAAGLNLHNILRFPTAFGWHKPLWVLIPEYVTVFAVTVYFLWRTRRQERRYRELSHPDDPDDLVVRPGDSLARATADSGGFEVVFAGGPRVAGRRNASVLELAERAGVPVEAGCRMGVCGSDPVAVLEGADTLSPATSAEQATLDRLGLAGCRMACVARVHGDVVVSTDVTDRRDQAAGLPPSGPGAADSSIRRLVVIGTGVAGVTAADYARRRHPDLEIDLIGEEVHSFYNRMGISRLVYARSALRGLQLHPDEWYQANRITTWLNTQAVEVHADSRAVVLGTGERLAYDSLVLAPGATPKVPRFDGDGEAFVVRTADDALGLRSLVQRRRCRNAVVIGGGLLGLEAAYSLHKLGLRVTILQRSAGLMHQQLDSRAAELVARYFRALGPQVVTGTEVARVDPGRVELFSGQTLAADIVVACAGIQPATALARAAGVAVDRGIMVDERMATSVPNVYAAGDAAEYLGVTTGLWPTAVEQGMVAGTNAVGGDAVYQPGLPLALLKGIGLTVQSVGVIDPEPGDDVELEDAGESEIRYRKVVRRGQRPIGAVFVGDWPDAVELTTEIQDAALLMPTG